MSSFVPNKVLSDMLSIRPETNCFSVSSINTKKSHFQIKVDTHLYPEGFTFSILDLSSHSQSKQFYFLNYKSRISKLLYAAVFSWLSLRLTLWHMQRAFHDLINCFPAAGRKNVWEKSATVQICLIHCLNGNKAKHFTNIFRLKLLGFYSISVVIHFQCSCAKRP